MSRMVALRATSSIQHEWKARDASQRYPAGGYFDEEQQVVCHHVQMCIAIPPKRPGASVIGFLKGKRAIATARLGGEERNFSGTFLGPRQRVSTVGFEVE